MPPDKTASPTPNLKMKHPAKSLTSTPILSYSLAAWPPDRRKELLRQLEAGELTELEFEAVVYRRGHNHNPVLFRDEDLDALAASFVGCPFLRNHDVDDIASRDGTIIASRMDGDDMVQTIQLTTERGIRDFLRGLIDRFSISWYWSKVECSVCAATGRTAVTTLPHLRRPTEPNRPANSSSLNRAARDQRRQRPCRARHPHPRNSPNSRRLTPCPKKSSM